MSLKDQNVGDVIVDGVSMEYTLVALNAAH